MKELVDKIVEKSQVNILGKSYEAVGKVHYVTIDNPTNEYVKVFLKGHYVLVISPNDNYMYFGKDMGSIWNEYPTPDKLLYDGQTFSKAVMDYQIVKSIEFGNPAELEGEVEFIDYEGKDDNLVSIGKVMRNGKRADVVAKIVEMTDVIID